MAVQVQGLAETVRQAKAAIDRASTVANKVNASATELVQTMADVEAMTTQLDAANAELKGALGTVTNGAPPLETGAKPQTDTSTASSASGELDPGNTGNHQGGPANGPNTGTAHDVHAAKIRVEADNQQRVASTADKYIPKVGP